MTSPLEKLQADTDLYLSFTDDYARAGMRSRLAQAHALGKAEGDAGGFARGVEAGAKSYADLLRGVQNTIPHDVGTDRQAYDHVILRMQDKFGSYTAQIALAVENALKPKREGSS